MGEEGGGGVGGEGGGGRGVKTRLENRYKVKCRRARIKESEKCWMQLPP